MSDKQFETLIRGAIIAARTHAGLMEKVGAECRARYGYHYSDIDADPIIDAVDLGHGDLNLKQFDDAMRIAKPNERHP